VPDLLPVEELALADPDRERLAVVGGLAGRMLERGGHRARLTLTERLEEAVEGADAVLIQLRVGGSATRIVDEAVPVACGCLGQETTGYGGLELGGAAVDVVLGGGMLRPGTGYLHDAVVARLPANAHALVPPEPPVLGAALAALEAAGASEDAGRRLREAFRDGLDPEDLR
jgi:Family 4 glycosyl hydrolase